MNEILICLDLIVGLNSAVCHLKKIEAHYKCLKMQQYHCNGPLILFSLAKGAICIHP